MLAGFRAGDDGARTLQAAETPAPRLVDGHPDFSGYWKGAAWHDPRAAISAKDLPGLEIAVDVPAGEAAWKHNLTATVDPEALCILGGIPRHNASGLPFEIVAGAKKVVFLFTGTVTTG